MRDRPMSPTSRPSATTMALRAARGRAERLTTTASTPYATMPSAEWPDGKLKPCSTITGSRRSGRSRAIPILNALLPRDASVIASAPASPLRHVRSSRPTAATTMATAVTAAVDPSSVIGRNGESSVASSGARTSAMTDASNESVRSALTRTASPMTSSTPPAARASSMPERRRSEDMGGQSRVGST
jgi:hypothetical protein